MDSRTFGSFVSEVIKIAEQTAFSKKQYDRIFGPKVLRKNPKFSTQKDNSSVGENSTLTNKNETYHPISSQQRVLENQQTPGGPL